MISIPLLPLESTDSLGNFGDGNKPKTIANRDQKIRRITSRTMLRLTPAIGARGYNHYSDCRHYLERHKSTSSSFNLKSGHSLAHGGSLALVVGHGHSGACSTLTGGFLNGRIDLRGPH